jgi:glycosyltransferase involved in cell wall biosynthesis
LISIIIPLYNKSEYIENTIKSVKSQKFLDFEVIIVDDGSTDGGVDLARQAICFDSRFRIVSQKNSGVSSARNHGARLAEGQLLSFLDADDEWDGGFLQQMWVLRLSYPSAKLYSSAYRLRRDGTLLEKSFGIESKVAMNYPFFALAAHHQPAIWTSATLVDSKTFLKVGGFPLEMSVGEDVVLWVKFIAEGDYVFLNECLATYDLTDATSLTKTTSEKVLEDQDKLISFLESSSEGYFSIPSEYINHYRSIKLSYLVRGRLYKRSIVYYISNIHRFRLNGFLSMLRTLKSNFLSRH